MGQEKNRDEILCLSASNEEGKQQKDACKPLGKSLTLPDVATRGTGQPLQEPTKQAVDLYRMRVRGLTFRRISQKTGLPRSTVFDLVRTVTEYETKATTEEVSALKNLELDRLEQLVSVLMTKVAQASPGEAAKLSDSLVKLSESRRKLLGLNEPEKLEISGQCLYVVKEASPDCPEWNEPFSAEK